jgi:NAD(P)-dependent dehydrogenase (short-subunit alcohol dehydrogenase family)
MFTPDLLKGRTLLVTGGGSGLGAAMARRFAELGARLWLCGRREGMLEQTAAEIREATGATVQWLRCDLRDAAQVETMMEAIWADGGLDVLINNAAATFIAQTERLSARAVDAALAPTLHGTTYCTLEAGRRWIDAGRPGWC